MCADWVLLRCAVSAVLPGLSSLSAVMAYGCVCIRSKCVGKPLPGPKRGWLHRRDSAWTGKGIVRLGRLLGALAA